MRNCVACRIMFSASLPFVVVGSQSTRAKNCTGFRQNNIPPELLHKERLAHVKAIEARQDERVKEIESHVRKLSAATNNLSSRITTNKQARFEHYADGRQSTRHAFPTRRRCSPSYGDITEDGSSAEEGALRGYKVNIFPHPT